MEVVKDCDGCAFMWKDIISNVEGNLAVIWRDILQLCGRCAVMWKDFCIDLEFAEGFFAVICRVCTTVMLRDFIRNSEGYFAVM